MSQIARDKDGLAGIMTLVDAADDQYINFINQDFGVIGLLFTGAFGATGTCRLHIGNQIGASNQEGKILNSIDGVFTNIDIDSPGLYFFRQMMDTLRIVLSAGTISTTNIVVTVFAPGRFAGSREV